MICYLESVGSKNVASLSDSKFYGILLGWSLLIYVLGPFDVMNIINIAFNFQPPGINILVIVGNFK